MPNEQSDFQPPQQGTIRGDPEREEIPEVLPAPRPPHPNFWWSVVWCLGFLGVLFGTIFVVLFAGIIINRVFSKEQRPVEAISPRQQPQASSQETSPGLARFKTSALRNLEWPLAAALFVGEFGSGVFAFIIIRQFVGRDWIRILGFRRPSASQLILVFISLPGMLVLADLIYKAAHETGVKSFENPKELAQLFGGWPLGFAVLVIGVGPGLSEELWCRGFLGRGLVGNYGAWIGILLTSVLFGALHIDPAHAVATACMGLWLHFVYLTSRSLWMPMLLHTLNNSVGVIGAFVQNEIEASTTQSLETAAVHPILKSLFIYLQYLDEAATKSPYLIFTAAMCLIGAVGWALYQCRTRLVRRENDVRPSWRPDFPGVEFPPPGTSTVVWRPWPGWQACGIVLAGILIFVLCIYLAPIVVP